MGSCSVLGCKSRSERKDDCVSFHRFPTNYMRRRKWIASTGRQNWEPRKRSKLCSVHFKRDAFKNNIKRAILKPTAVPEINIHHKDNATNTDTCELFQGTVESCFCKPGITSSRRRLKQGAIPSQRLPELCNAPKRLKQEPDSLDVDIKKINMLSSDDNAFECRACFQKFDYDAGLLNLFEAWDPPWNGMGSTVAEDLATLTSVQISIADPYSKLICPMCHLKLLEACTFVANVRLNDRIMREKADLQTTLNYSDKDYMQQETIWPKPIQVIRDMNTTILENSTAVEVKQEVMSEDECDANDLENVYKESDYSNLDIKTEPEEIMEPPNIQITVNGTITLDQFAKNSITNGDINPDDKCLTEETKVKEEPLSEVEDEDVEMTPDLPLECLLCTKNFHSVSGLKAHVISQHSYDAVERKPDVVLTPTKKERYMCATCRCSFETRTDLMVHETRHNDYSCYLCNAKYNSFEGLTEHSKKCKASHSKVIQKPKTLEDVKRPQVPSPETESTDWLSSSDDKTQPCDALQDEESRSTSSVEVHLHIHSLSENNKTVSSDKDVEIKTEPLDSNVSDE